MQTHYYTIEKPHGHQIRLRSNLKLYEITFLQPFTTSCKKNYDDSLESPRDIQVQPAYGAMTGHDQVDIML